jgi:predicted  nucleic acid-binding Zn ribbon protein
MSKRLREATAWSKRRAQERTFKIQTSVFNGEAWAGSQEAACPSCGMTLDLANPAVAKDKTCACGASLEALYASPR